MALRLISRSPRRRIRLVTVTAGLMAHPIRLDQTRHRQLDTSNGCRDHTVLPYALASFVLHAVLAHGKPPCEHTCAPTLPRPPHPRPTSVTIAIRPSCGPGWRELVALICPTGQAEYFLNVGLTEN